MASVSRDGLDVSLSTDGMEVRIAELGGMAVAFHRIAKGYDPAPHYRGLPDDMCPCTHWGYILKGKLKMRKADGEVELLEEGHAFHLDPGHIGEVIEDTEIVEFTPLDEYRAKTAHVASNIGGSPGPE